MNRFLEPGLNFIIPYVDNVAYKVTTKDIVLDIPSQEVITRDNVVIIANAVAYINILHPERAVYGIEIMSRAFVIWYKPHCVLSLVIWILIVRYHRVTKSKPR